MSWRIFLATCIFLLLTLFGSVGGCVFGFLATYPFQGSFSPFWLVWGVGTLIGIGAGIFLAQTILRNWPD